MHRFLVMCALLLFLVLVGCDAGHRSDRPVDSGVAEDANAIDRTGHDVLFVGNSYVFVNDVSGLYRLIAGAVSAQRVRVEEVTAGGYRLAQHAADVRSDETPIAHWLRTGSAEETAFDAVILQEQSQIGGFPTLEAARMESVAAFSELASLATRHGASVVLYMTWGYEHGDPLNTASGFGTYEGMQDSLTRNYLAVAGLLAEQGNDVRVAPVGIAFRIVREDAIARGDDPDAPESDFGELYEPDGSHPSARGAYLAACVLAGTILEADVDRFIDAPALGPDVSRDLRSACGRALRDPRNHVSEVVRADAQLASDREADANFGFSVAIARDGSRILVGEPALDRDLDDPMMASARVFASNGTGWQEERMWRGPRAFGSAVTLDRDATHAAASNTVMIRSATSWSEHPLVPDVEVLRATDSLAISGDGTRLVVGRSPEPNEVGEESELAVIYLRSGDSWVREGAVRGRPTEALTPRVSIDAAGERVLVGESPSIVAMRDHDTWKYEATLAATGLPFAIEVALSPDGMHAVIGQSLPPRALVFSRVDATWTLVRTLNAPPSSHVGEFASSVAISTGGHRVAVGIRADQPTATARQSGSVYVFDLQGNYAQPDYVLVPGTKTTDGTFVPVHRSPIGFEVFGDALAMSDDGTRIVVGAPGTADCGAAYVFDLPLPHSR